MGKTRKEKRVRARRSESTLYRFRPLPKELESILLRIHSFFKINVLATKEGLFTRFRGWMISPGGSWTDDEVGRCLRERGHHLVSLYEEGSG